MIRSLLIALVTCRGSSSGHLGKQVRHPRHLQGKFLWSLDRSRHLQGKFLRVRIPNNVVGVNDLCFSSLAGGSSSESVLVDNQWRRITPVVGSRDQCSRGDRRCDHPLDLRFSTPSWTPSWRRNNSGFGDNLAPL